MTRDISRRRMVQLSGAAVLGAFAGCDQSQSNGSTGGRDGGTTTASSGMETPPTETAVETTATGTAETSAAETETAAETAETETSMTETGAAETASEESVTPHGDIHAHGSMVVEINGETYTLADKSWNYEENTGEAYFHFHASDDHYHLHAEGVTFEYALDSLPRIEASTEAFEFRGHKYDTTDPGTTVSYTADSEAVGLDYVIPESAPELRVVVETDDPTPTAVPADS